MTLAPRKDRNHQEIVAKLRSCNCSVLDVAALKNCCDLFVAHQGRTWAVEIKDGEKPPSGRKLTEGEESFRLQWMRHGEWRLITSVEDAMKMLKEKR